MTFAPPPSVRSFSPAPKARSDARGMFDRLSGRTALNADDIDRMAAAAWQERGVALIDPGLVTDDFARQAIVNEANRRYGKRAYRPDAAAVTVAPGEAR